MDAHRRATSPQQLPLRNWLHNTGLFPRYRPRDTIGRFSRRHMNDVTLVHIIPRDRLILLELDGGLLILLLVVLDPKI